MRRRHVRGFASCSLLTCAIFAFTSLPAIGQTLGQLTGRITDSSGAAVTGVNVTLVNIATNASRSTVTTGDGDYTFASIPPGIYDVKAEHSGFRVAAANHVEVQVQQTVRQDLSLEVGQVNESVQVSASADLLQTENLAMGTVVENKMLTELPLGGRNYLSLVALSSNVETLSPSSGQAGSRQGGDRASQSISAAGQRIMFDYFTLDGVNNTDPDFNTYVTLPSIDAIQEFKVQTGIYPAEFGHQATQINVVTKSGRQQLSWRPVRFHPQRQVRLGAVRVRHGPPHQIAVQVERLRIRGRWPGPHPENRRRPQPSLLHGER